MTPLLSNPLLRAQSDDRLAELAAAGHDRAFEAIVERYRKPLNRYLRRLLSEQLAEDVLQATFVRAWQALGTGPRYATCGRGCIGSPTTRRSTRCAPPARPNPSCRARWQRRPPLPTSPRSTARRCAQRCAASVGSRTASAPR
jgi:hypothetical protein